jgi:hypothetical protein
MASLPGFSVYAESEAKAGALFAWESLPKIRNDGFTRSLRNEFCSPNAISASKFYVQGNGPSVQERMLQFLGALNPENLSDWVLIDRYCGLVIDASLANQAHQDVGQLHSDLDAAV